MSLNTSTNTTAEDQTNPFPNSPRTNDDELLDCKGTELGEPAVRDHQRQNDEHNGQNDEGKNPCSALSPGLLQAHGCVHQGKKQQDAERDKNVHNSLLFKAGLAGEV